MPIVSRQEFVEHIPVLRSYFDETIYLPFHMLELPAPSHYDEMLTQYYGNWREFVIRPPHSKFYDTDRSYKYYLEHGLPDGVEV